MCFKNVSKFNLLLVLLGFFLFSACNPNENYHRLSSTNSAYSKKNVSTKRNGTITSVRTSSNKNRSATYTTKTNESSAISTTRRVIVDKALSYQGTPYQYGGKSPQSGFDCSGLISHCFAQSGQSLTGSSSMMAQQGRPKALGAVVPGDLLFFGSQGKVSHVAIAYKKIDNEVYIIHATSKAGVRIDNMTNSKYWTNRYLFTRDLLN